MRSIDGKTMKHIFLIGFNKCGTTSFHDFFKANGLTSVHWRANTLAMRIHDNLQNGVLPLLSGLERWTAYSDMVCIPGSPWGQSNSDAYPLIEACRYFKELDHSYPDSLFILNTRNREAWIESRLRHDQGQFAAAYLRALLPNGIHTKGSMVAYWQQLWQEHYNDVTDYFQAEKQARFLRFDLDQIDQTSLLRFLEPHFRITNRHFPHSHRTAS